MTMTYMPGNVQQTNKTSDKSMLTPSHGHFYLLSVDISKKLQKMCCADDVQTPNTAHFSSRILSIKDVLKILLLCCPLTI